MISEVIQTTKLWSMQGLGASTTPAAVSSTSFYVTSGPGDTPGRTILPSAHGARGHGSLAREVKMFETSFKSDPTRPHKAQDTYP
mmetsp:Transcript_10914/g.17165  ORF Transcript_10914/g.17165 Transcript_10914/m.17165 type:complete len:85 (+) Transcript_10914:28-282(+)